MFGFLFSEAALPLVGLAPFSVVPGSAGTAAVSDKLRVFAAGRFRPGVDFVR
jgi:hypothetical protein